MTVQPARSWRRVGMGLGVALLFSVLGWFSLNQPVSAQAEQPMDVLAQIQVDTNNPAINDDDFCSIIEAIENANADAQLHDDCPAGSGDDTIVLPVDAALLFTVRHNTVGGSNALPVITSNISVIGNGATLVRNVLVGGNFRFFHVAAGGTLRLSDLSLRNGTLDKTSTTELLFGGGAIINHGRLHIVDSNLSFNRADFGGAIYSQAVTGTLALTNTTFSSNIADLDGGAIYNLGSATINGSLFRLNEALITGGAIVHNSGDMTLTGSTIRDNTTAGTGAGIVSYASLSNSQVWIRTSNVISNVAGVNAGGILNSANHNLTAIMQIEGSSITGNRVSSTAAGAGYGGGIVNGWVQGGLAGGIAEMEVVLSYVADNVAQAGGGIANLDVTASPGRDAEILISQSTLARNTAAGSGSERGSGGGFLNSNAEATVVNSTISSNQALGNDTAFGGRGGGISNFGSGDTTTLELLNSTLAFNEASQAGGGLAVVGKVVTATTAAEVGNTLIVNNELDVSESVTTTDLLASIGALQVIAGTESCSIEDGTLDSLGGNIEDGATCDFDADSDRTETAVELGVLANNGGATPTHLIEEDGPAYNTGIDALCTAAPVRSTDQRGITRPQQGRCDVGAVEVIAEDLNLRFPQIYKDYRWP